MHEQIIISWKAKTSPLKDSPYGLSWDNELNLSFSKRRKNDNHKFLIALKLLNRTRPRSEWREKDNITTSEALLSLLWVKWNPKLHKNKEPLILNSVKPTNQTHTNKQRQINKKGWEMN